MKSEGSASALHPPAGWALVSAELKGVRNQGPAPRGDDCFFPFLKVSCIYFGLCWVCSAACRLSLVVGSSSRWLLWVPSAGSEAGSLGGFDTLSGSMACGILQDQEWNP